jgi:membrane protein implicated in regulation of membrane protease activity
MLRSDCHPSALFLTLAFVFIVVPPARWLGPVHEIFGLESVVWLGIVVAAGTATSVYTWRSVKRERWRHARIAQIPDFALWTMAPIVAAYSCSSHWGVLLALGIHALALAHCAKTMFRTSWLLRSIGVATWLPLFALTWWHGWVWALGAFSLLLFILANQAANFKRAEEKRREDRQRAEAEAREQRIKSDFEVLVRDYLRVRAERDRQSPEG